MVKNNGESLVFTDNDAIPLSETVCVSSQISVRTQISPDEILLIGYLDLGIGWGGERFLILLVKRTRFLT